MSETRSVVAGVEVCAEGASANAVGVDFGSGWHIVLPSPFFFPSLAAAFGITQFGRRAFDARRITSMSIPHHVQILRSSCFSSCKSLSSISFETNSDLTCIKFYHFGRLGREGGTRGMARQHISTCVL
jgi:hypothetical protein